MKLIDRNKPSSGLGLQELFDRVRDCEKVPKLRNWTDSFNSPQIWPQKSRNALQVHDVELTDEIGDSLEKDFSRSTDPASEG